MSSDPVSGIRGIASTEAEMRNIYSDLRGLVDAVQAETDKLGGIEAEIELLWRELQATKVERRDIQQQLKAHLDSKPLEPERVDYPDEAAFNAGLTRYQAAISAWSAAKSQLEHRLQDVDHAISGLREEIRGQLKVLSKLTAQVEELGAQAEELESQAKAMTTRSTLAIYRDIKAIKDNLAEKLEAFLRMVERIWAGLPARFRTEP